MSLWDRVTGELLDIIEWTEPSQNEILAYRFTRYKNEIKNDAKLIVREGQAAVFVCVDHYSAALLGVHAAKRATRWEALDPVRQAVRDVFGAISKDIATGLALRHDHGTQYLADDFQSEIAFLGIDPEILHRLLIAIARLLVCPDDEPCQYRRARHHRHRR